MRTKIHIGILILVLTCLGVVSQQQTQKANQEIVFHFTNIEASSNEAQNTISVVKEQLYEIGVSNIKVSHQDNGKLKISYYSDVDVANVKAELFNKMKLDLDYVFEHEENNANHSSGEDSPNFNLDIYEIQNTQQSNSGFDGCVLVKKSEFDRYYDPNTFFAFSTLQVRNDNNSEKVALKVWGYVENRISNPFNIFPEVRAGPKTFGNV